MTVRSIDGLPVMARLAMRMKDSLPAFAVRAACFIGELGVPFAEEFDGHDCGATHVFACLGDEPVGAVRLRWFHSFALTERLAVIRPRLHHALRSGPAPTTPATGKSKVGAAWRRATPAAGRSSR